MSTFLEPKHIFQKSIFDFHDYGRKSSGTILSGAGFQIKLAHCTLFFQVGIHWESVGIGDSMGHVWNIAVLKGFVHAFWAFIDNVLWKIDKILLPIRISYPAIRWVKRGQPCQRWCLDVQGHFFVTAFLFRICLRLFVCPHSTGLLFLYLYMLFFTYQQTHHWSGWNRWTIM